MVSLFTMNPIIFVLLICKTIISPVSSNSLSNIAVSTSDLPVVSNREVVSYAGLIDKPPSSLCSRLLHWDKIENY